MLGSSSTTRIRAIAILLPIWTHAREEDGETAAFPHLAFEANSPAMCSRDRVDHRQPDARPLRTSLPRCLTADELLKNTLALLVRYTRPLIQNGHTHPAVLLRQSCRDERACGRVLGCVVEQIPKRAAQCLAVGSDCTATGKL